MSTRAQTLGSCYSILFVLSHIMKTSRVEVIVVSGLPVKTKVTMRAEAKPTVHHTFPLRGLDAFPLPNSVVLMAVII